VNVDVAIDRASYHFKNQQEKETSFFLASLTFRYLWNSSSTAYATNNNKEK